MPKRTTVRKGHQRDGKPVRAHEVTTHVESAPVADVSDTSVSAQADPIGQQQRPAGRFLYSRADAERMREELAEKMKGATVEWRNGGVPDSEMSDQDK